MASFLPGLFRTAAVSGTGSGVFSGFADIPVGTYTKRTKNWRRSYDRQSYSRRNNASQRVGRALKDSRTARFVAEGYTSELDARWQRQSNRLRWLFNDLQIFAHRISSVLSRLKIGRINAVLIIMILVLLIASSQFYSIGMELYIDGQRIGYVLSEQDYTDAAKTVEEEAAYYLDRPYKLAAVPTFSFSFVRKNQTLDTADLESVLFSLINEVQNMYVLKVDGEIVGAYKYRSAIDQILDKRLNSFTPENAQDVRVEFVKDVEINYSLVDLSYNRSTYELEKLINADVDEDIVHTIKTGDSLESIGRQYGVTKSSIAGLNPGVTDASLAAGEQLLIATKAPFLPVQLVASESYSEVLPFEIEKRNSDKIYKNQSEVMNKGSEGEAVVTAEVTYLNGVEVGRQITDRVVVKEPVKQVVLIGTKTLPPTVSTGTYIRPYNGVITSNYGWRTWRGSYQEFHTGVDFAGPRGSAVVAADGGTVTFAGWMGNYGRCVIIRHDEHTETLYAHNDVLVVEVGQKVAQGEKISEIGMTGRTTGPHVHFEVRVDGHDVNPFNYLSN